MLCIVLPSFSLSCKSERDKTTASSQKVVSALTSPGSSKNNTAPVTLLGSTPAGAAGMESIDTTDKPREKKRREARASQAKVAPTRSAPPVTATPPPEPARQVPAATGEPLVTWYCLCYSETSSGASEPATACRRTKSQCRRLQKLARRGVRSLVANSVTRTCQRYHVAHPGDSLGGREKWLPSSRPGAWWSRGQCLIP